MKDLFGREPILALSWRQPFGSAMLIGKQETRVWQTGYRGKVLICTSKLPYPEGSAREICGEENFIRMCKALGNQPDTLDFDGYAIAVGDLVNCRRMKPTDEESTFVSYRADLYVHEYRNVRAIKPFPWVGSLGWTRLTDEQISRIEYLPALVA